MVQQQIMQDALHKRRQALLAKMVKAAVRTNPDQMERIARELREISKKLDSFLN